MKENLIKLIQKFINTPFFYADLLVYLDKQKDFLLQESILQKTETNEYNSLWDTICFLERHFLFAKEPNYIIGSKISILSIYNLSYKERVESIK